MDFKNCFFRLCLSNTLWFLIRILLYSGDVCIAVFHYNFVGLRLTAATMDWAALYPAHGAVRRGR